MTDMIVNHKITVVEGTKTGSTISTYSDHRSLATSMVARAIKRCDTTAESQRMAEFFRSEIDHALEAVKEWHNGVDE